MEEETIIGSKDFEQEKEAMQQETPLTDGNKRERRRMSAAAGVGAAVGVGLGVLTPKMVFPISEDVDEISVEEDGEGMEEVEATASSAHLVGHDMDVATGVDDSMSFGEAFAAARHEVGADGMFVWHGNTYGTHTAEEWNAMSQEDQDQYWANVNHTTSHMTVNPTDESIDDLIEGEDVAEVIDDQDEGGDGDAVADVIDEDGDAIADVIDEDGDSVVEVLDEDGDSIADVLESGDADEIDILEGDDLSDDFSDDMTDDLLIEPGPDMDVFSPLDLDADPDLTMDDDMNMDDFV